MLINNRITFYFDIYTDLRAPLNKQDTNNPGNPGICPSTSITNKGNNYNKDSINRHFEWNLNLELQDKKQQKKVFGKYMLFIVKIYFLL